MSINLQNNLLSYTPKGTLASYTLKLTIINQAANRKIRNVL